MKKLFSIFLLLPIICFAQLPDFSPIQKPAPTASLSASPTSVTAPPNVVGGGAGTATFYDLTGSGLGTNAITVTAPTGHEVSKDNSNFAGTQTVTPSGGSVTQRMYDRLKGANSAGSYPGTITNVCAGASLSAPVTTSGTTNAAPTFAHNQAHTTSSGTVSSTLTNFTMKIEVTAASLATVANGGSMTNSSANDLVVSTNSAGSSLLKWHIETYIPTTGKLVIWVLVPSLPSGSATDVYLCWGNSGITTFQGGSLAASWDASILRSYHMNEVLTAAGQSVLDYSGNGQNMTTVGTYTSAQSVAGKAGNGLQLLTGNGDYFTMPTLTLSGDFTYSQWVYITDVSQNSFTLGNSSATQSFNWFGAQARLFHPSASPTDMVIDATTTPINTWVYITVTRTGSALTIYHNGTQTATGTSSQSVVFNLFGKTSTAISAVHQGDELRFWSVGESGARVAAEYGNMNGVFPTAGTIN